jgi:hypothetical protein
MPTGEAGLLLILALIFGSIAGLMANLITYEEYKKHFPGGHRAKLESLKTALVAFLFFTGIPALIWFFLLR